LKRKQEASAGIKSDSPELLPQTFLCTTLQRIESIKKGLKRLAQELDDSRTLNDVKLNFHKISGSSGIYGYPEIGQMARKAESKITETEQGEMELDRDVIMILTHETEEMEKLLTAALDQKDFKPVDFGSDQPRSYLPVSSPRDEISDRETRPVRILVVDDD
jgi:chemotaxis protein histidine kinase CheA